MVRAVVAVHYRDVRREWLHLPQGGHHDKGTYADSLCFPPFFLVGT